MALEVSEIGIRMRVEDGEGKDADDQKEQPELTGCRESLDRDEIVDDCVRRVLQILQRQRER